MTSNHFAFRSLLFASIISVFLSGVSAVALPAPLTVKPNSISTPLRSQGTLQGGQTNEEFSLLGVQALKSVSKSPSQAAASEKIVLNYGDRYGKTVKGSPGYFQVALDKSGQRVVIDLAQVTSTGIEPAQLRKIFSNSKLVASSEMTMDPHDRSTNITLTLKEPVEVTVATEATTKAKVILEMKPVSSLRRTENQ